MRSQPAPGHALLVFTRGSAQRYKETLDLAGLTATPSREGFCRELPGRRAVAGRCAQGGPSRYGFRALAGPGHVEGWDVRRRDRRPAQLGRVRRWGCNACSTRSRPARRQLASPSGVPARRNVIDSTEVRGHRGHGAKRGAMRSISDTRPSDRPGFARRGRAAAVLRPCRATSARSEMPSVPQTDDAESAADRARHAGQAACVDESSGSPVRHNPVLDMRSMSQPAQTVANEMLGDGEVSHPGAWQPHTERSRRACSRACGALSNSMAPGACLQTGWRPRRCLPRCSTPPAKAARDAMMPVEDPAGRHELPRAAAGQLQGQLKSRRPGAPPARAESDAVSDDARRPPGARARRCQSAASQSSLAASATAALPRPPPAASGAFSTSTA